MDQGQDNGQAPRLDMERILMSLHLFKNTQIVRVSQATRVRA